MQTEKDNPSSVLGSAALGMLLDRLKSGTFGEVLEDWR